MNVLNTVLLSGLLFGAVRGNQIAGRLQQESSSSVPANSGTSSNVVKDDFFPRLKIQISAPPINLTVHYAYMHHRWLVQKGGTGRLYDEGDSAFEVARDIFKSNGVWCLPGANQDHSALCRDVMQQLTELKRRGMEARKLAGSSPLPMHPDPPKPRPSVAVLVVSTQRRPPGTPSSPLYLAQCPIKTT